MTHADKNFIMKHLFTSLFALASFVLSAQTFNSPESVEYDAAGDRWLVGNNGAGTIVSFYPQSNLTVPFASGIPSGPHGIEILNGVAYCCDGGTIKGFDLTNGSQVFNLNLSASFLNGLTSDGANYLFTTDFSGKKIYRVNPANNSFNLMTTTVKTPNGIIYDGANNRCIFVTWGNNAPIQAMSLADSTISTLLTTSLSNVDGINKDVNGNYYVSAWGTNALYRVDPSFTTAPVSVMTGLSGPADLGANTAGDSIAIPNSNSTTVVFYVISGLGTEAHSELAGPEILAINNSIVVNGDAANVSLYSVDGKLLQQVVAVKGRAEFSGLKPATYIVVVSDANGEMISRKKIALAGN
jgi:hypothetical protein